MFSFALNYEGMILVSQVNVAFSRHDDVAVALFGVLQSRKRVRLVPLAKILPQERALTFHQISSGMIASTFLILWSGSHPSHCNRVRGQLTASSARPLESQAHLVTEALYHVRALIFGRDRKFDDARLDWRGERFACEHACIVRTAALRSRSSFQPWKGLPVVFDRP